MADAFLNAANALASKASINMKQWGKPGSPTSISPETKTQFLPILGKSSQFQQLADYGRNFNAQAGKYVSALGKGLSSVGLDSTGEATTEVGDVTTKYWEEGITPETKKALSESYLDDGGGNLNVRKILMDGVVDPANVVLGGVGKLVGGAKGTLIAQLPNGAADLGLKVAQVAGKGYAAVRKEIASGRAVGRAVKRRM